MIETRKTFLRSGAAPLLIGFLILACMIGAVLWFVASEQADAQAMRRSLEVESELVGMMSTLTDAETGQRGYLLTGDAAYLEPYRKARDRFGTQLDALGALVAANPAQAQALEAFGHVAKEKIDELGATIASYRAGSKEEALDSVRSGAGKVLMDEARDIIGRMLQVEDRTQSDRRARLEALASWLRYGVIGSGAMFLALAAFAAMNSYGQMAKLVASRDELRASNRQLVEEAARRAALADQLRQSQKMEAIGQLTGGLAHDFNNMLSVIVGSLTLLKRRLARGESDIGKYVDTALEGADRAANLTHRLLAFSRRQPLAPQSVDVNKLVAGMSDLLRRTIGEQISVETVLAGGLWRTRVDRGELENAILNLAVNARDAMAEGGRLTIETANCHLDDTYASAHVDVPAGQYVLVAVTDNGCGMPPDVRTKAFDPFFTTKGVGKGTGLGLSQVHGFVKQSGGHVKIYSEPGEGTTIKLYLPRFHGAEQAAAERSVERPSTARRRRQAHPRRRGRGARPAGDRGEPARARLLGRPCRQRRLRARNPRRAARRAPAVHRHRHARRQRQEARRGGAAPRAGHQGALHHRLHAERHRPQRRRRPRRAADLEAVHPGAAGAQGARRARQRVRLLDRIPMTHSPSSPGLARRPR